MSRQDITGAKPSANDFEAMSLNRIEATLSPENAASMRVLERLGFVREGHFLQHGYWAGKYHDGFQYCLLRERWTSNAGNGNSSIEHIASATLT